MPRQKKLKVPGRDTANKQVANAALNRLANSPNHVAAKVATTDTSNPFGDVDEQVHASDTIFLKDRRSSLNAVSPKSIADAAVRKTFNPLNMMILLNMFLHFIQVDAYQRYIILLQ